MANNTASLKNCSLWTRKVEIDMKQSTIPRIALLSLLALAIAGCGTQPAALGPNATGTSVISATLTPASGTGSTVKSVPTEVARSPGTQDTPIPSSTGEPAGANTQTPIASHGGPVKDYVSFIDKLRALGATVNPVGESSQSFFSVKGYRIAVNGADVQVFEYADSAAVGADVAKISPDGISVGTSMVDWVGTPHFFKADKIVVLYVGDDSALLNILDQALGKQFAGR